MNVHFTALWLAVAASLAAVADAQNTAPRPPQELAPLIGGIATTPSVWVTTGSTVATWSNIEAGISRVWATRSNGRGVKWQPPVRVDTDSTYALKLSLSDSVQRVGSHVYILWIDDRNGPGASDVYMNVSSDGGATFALSDMQLPHPLGGAGEVRGVRIASGLTPFGEALHVAMRVAPAGSADEELYITSTLDGGNTWSVPLHLAGNTTQGRDVDQIAIACSGSRVHLIWEDDSSNGAGRYSVYHVRSTDFGATFGIAQRLDTTDPGDLGNSDAPGEHGLQLRLNGDQVAAVWVEERTHPSNEEVRWTLSTDGGVSFAPDERIGGGNPLVVDVDYVDLWLRNNIVMIAFTDNRVGLGSLDQLYVWRRLVSGTTGVETIASNATGAAFPRFAGSGNQVALAWLTDSTIRQSLTSRTSDDNGLTWQPQARLYDAQNGRDVDLASIGFDPSYDNVIAAFLVDSGPSGENRVYTGGVRPPTLVPQGFSPAAPFISFRGENLIEGDATIMVVAVGWAAAEGSLVLPDMRDVGISYDALTATGLTLLPSLVAPIQPNGVANTPALVNGLPPGLTFCAVGVTISPTIGTVRLTDVAVVTVN